MKIRALAKAVGTVLVGALILAGCGGGGEPRSQAPEPPTDLQARVLHDGSVHLAWQLESTGHDEVVVYRSGSLEPAQSGQGLMAVLPAGATEYVDHETAVGEVYVYRVGVVQGNQDAVLSADGGRVEPMPELSSNPYVWSDELSTSAPNDVQRGLGLETTAGGVPTLNPVTNITSNYLLDLLDGLGASLVRRDAADNWEPYAASSFTSATVGEGGVITVQLRPGIRWSDGTPVTAVDYVLRYELESDPDMRSNALNSWNGITVAANGSHELVYTFSQLVRTAMVMLHKSPLPDHLLGELYREGGAEAVRAAWGADTAPADLVTTGPWALFESASDYYVLARNPYYGAWNHDSASQRLPHVDTLTLHKSNLSNVEAFIAGVTDFVSVAENQAQEIQAGMTDFEWAPRATAAASNEYFVFNHNLASDPFLQGLFRDARFKTAMSHLVDRDWIIDELLGGAATPQWTSVYLTYPTWVNDAVPRHAYDPAEAARILQEELGFTLNEEGLLTDSSRAVLSFRMTANDSSDRRMALANQFREWAAAVGIEVEVELITFSELITRVYQSGNDRDLHGFVLGSVGGSRDWPFSNLLDCPAGSALWNTSGDCAGWEQEIGDLVAQGRTELDDAAALAIGNQIQSTEAANLPYIYTANSQLSFFWWPHVKGELPAERMASSGFQRHLELTWVQPR